MASNADDLPASQPEDGGTYNEIDVTETEDVEPAGEEESSNRPTMKSGRIESLEIELGAPHGQDTGDVRRLVSVSSEDDDEVEGGNEAVSLLGSQSKTEGGDDGNDVGESANGNSTPTCIKCCEPELRMGKITVPSLYVYGYTGGWGTVGPHYMGPPCLMALIAISTYYFAVERSLRHHWYLTFLVCCYLGLQTLYFLFSAAYRDPGVVREGRLNLPKPVPRSYRWCESCNYYQPPTTMHCPSCEACVAGFDHHCVWMGTCVGVGNFKPFMRFNLSWIGYLLYAIIWVSVIAPLTDKHH